MKSLDISVNPIFWDLKKDELKFNCPNKNLILQLILKTKLEYQKRLLEKETNVTSYVAMHTFATFLKKLRKYFKK